MSNPKWEARERRACGNWLGKQRRTIYITNRCWDLTHALGKEFGLNHSSVFEIAVREKYVRDIGPVPPIEYAGGEKAK